MAKRPTAWVMAAAALFAIEAATTTSLCAHAEESGVASVITVMSYNIYRGGTMRGNRCPRLPR